MSPYPLTLCHSADLPTPYTPIVVVDGKAEPAYLFSDYDAVGMLTASQCLGLNDGYEQVYFFGELRPPYIDVLGRGAHLRETNAEGVRYGNPREPRCYRNTQALGSKVRARLRRLTACLCVLVA
jgi:hypothetical protein